MERVAIIDLGSNTARMEIFEIYENGSYKMINYMKDTIRLSEGLSEGSLLLEEPVLRALDVLKSFKSSIAQYKVSTIIPIATAAVRQSNNQEWFLKKVFKETGFNFRVISGDEEARYDYLGVINTLLEEDFYLIDIGGASTENALVKERVPVEFVSIPFGAVTLTESFGSSSKESYLGFQKAFHKVFSEFDKLKWIAKNPELPIIGVGGTMRSIAKLDKTRKSYPLSNIHYYQMTHNDLRENVNYIIEKSKLNKKKIPGISKKRTDIIVGGIAPIMALIDITKSNEVIFSVNGLREGAFLEFYSSYSNLPDSTIGNVRQHVLDNIVKKYLLNETHIKKLIQLSLRLFDALEGLHNMSNFERNLLISACYMHDMGAYIDFYQHPKHSFYLILNTELNGFTHKELVMCAFLCGMHQQDQELKEDISNYIPIISEKDIKNLEMLKYFLMLAESLDYFENGVINDINIDIYSDKIFMSILSDQNSDIEILQAKKCISGFNKVFKKTLLI